MSSEFESYIPETEPRENEISNFDTGLEKLKDLVKEKSASQERVIVVIDGKPNSGKSTLSRKFLESNNPSNKFYCATGINSLEVQYSLNLAKQSKVIFFEEIEKNRVAADIEMQKYFGQNTDIFVYLHSSSSNMKMPSDLSQFDIVIENSQANIK